MKSTATKERADLWVRLGLVLLLAYAAATRLTGADYLLPHLSEPDQYLVPQAEYLWEGGDPKAAPLSFFWYYSLLPQALALTPDPALTAARARADSLEEQLAAASEPVRRMRLLVALLAVGLAPGTYLLARRFLRPSSALLAAGLMATCFLHMQMSTQARPHAAQATLALFAVLGALHLRARPSVGAYATAGVLAALAVGCLQNGVFVLPALVVAHVLREQGAGADERERLLARATSGLPRLALAFVPIIAAFLWFGPAFNEAQEDTRTGRAPYGRPETPYEGLERESYNDPLALRDGAIELGPQRLELQWFDGTGLRRSVKFLWWNDPVLLVFGIVGALLAATRVIAAWRGLPKAARRPPVLGALRSALDSPRACDLFVALSYALPFLLVLGSYARTWGRFLLPVFPYLACLAAAGGAWAISLATRRISSPSVRGIASAAAGVALLALPGYAVLHRALLQNRPDTLELAARWIEERLDPREHRLLVDQGLTLPLFLQRDALASDLQYRAAQTSRWPCYQDLFLAAPPADQAYDARRVPQGGETRALLMDPQQARALLRESGADHVVLEVSQRTRASAPLAQFHETVRANGELVARFTAREPEESDLAWMDYQDAPYMLWRNLRAHALGPRIEIWRLVASEDRAADGGR